MKEKVNIMCLYWVGEFRGRDFSINDIERLYQTVSKHIDREFDFYVLTNTKETLPDYCNRIDLLYAWPGWWSKVELHRPDLPKGRTLYMDLDSHCIRSLGPILDYVGRDPKELVMFPTGIDKKKWQPLRSKGWVCWYQAATMLFTPGCQSMKLVWDRFTERPFHWMKKYRSEQDIMGEWIPDQPMFPRNWMCKLRTLEDRFPDGPPDDVIIVTGQDKTGLFRNTNRIPWFEKMAR
jgi:hypothetical protein